MNMRTWILYAVATAIAPLLAGCAKDVVHDVRLACPVWIRCANSWYRGVRPAGNDKTVVFKPGKKGKFTMECGILCRPEARNKAGEDNVGVGSRLTAQVNSL